MILLTQCDTEASKLGDNVRATYRKVGPTCPNTCQHLQDGSCYAMRGRVNFHQSSATPDPDDGPKLLSYLLDLPQEKYIRHHVAGDVYDEDEVDEKYVRHLIEGHKKRPDLRGWTYTHGWRDMDADRMNAPKSLCVNASCDTLNEVEEAKQEGWPTVVVQDDPIDKKGFVTCPAQTDGLTCSECKLCMISDRESTIVFLKH